MDIIYFET